MKRFLALLLVTVLAGCSVLDVANSAKPAACPTALIEGVLVELPPDALVLETDDGPTYAIDWSGGYAIRSGPPIELVDRAGAVVARVGDRVAIAGGETGQQEELWRECGGVTVIAPAH